MPPIGMALGGVNFSSLKIVLKDAILNDAGEVTKVAVSLNYGNFFQITIDFIIIAFAIFLVVKAMNNMKKKEEATPAPPDEDKLLTEIRDLLKEKK